MTAFRNWSEFGIRTIVSYFYLLFVFRIFGFSAQLLARIYLKEIIFSCHYYH